MLALLFFPFREIRWNTWRAFFLKVLRFSTPVENPLLLPFPRGTANFQVGLSKDIYFRLPREIGL